jgi:hypothetical protein
MAYYLPWLSNAAGGGGETDAYPTTNQKYVRQGASGTASGNDWTNAYTSFSGVTFATDTTYWVAGGTYSGFDINASGTAGAYIRVKRATSSIHGTDTGWSAGYDAQVTFDGSIEIGYGSATARNYIIIDGSKRTSLFDGYGFRHIYSGSNAGQSGIMAPYGANNLILRYLDIGSTTDRFTEDGIQGRGNDLIIEYCMIHDCDVIDPPIDQHGDGIQWFEGTNLTIRYCAWLHNGQHIYLGEDAWSEVVVNAKIYYNYFDNLDRNSSPGNAGVLINFNDETSNLNAQIYNNTFFQGDLGWITFYPRGLADLTVKNNVFYVCDGSEPASTVHSYNGWDNGGTGACSNIPTETGRVAAADLGFVDAPNGDFTIQSSSVLRNAGTDVSSVALNSAGQLVDILGNAIASPTTPTIGAFEYV